MCKTRSLYLTATPCSSEQHSHNYNSFHSKFVGVCASCGKTNRKWRHHAAFSNYAELHNLNLENSPTTQAESPKPLCLNSHISEHNDGYYCFLLSFLSLYPLSFLSHERVPITRLQTKVVNQGRFTLLSFKNPEI